MVVSGSKKGLIGTLKREGQGGEKVREEEGLFKCLLFKYSSEFVTCFNLDAQTRQKKFGPSFHLIERKMIKRSSS